MNEQVLLEGGNVFVSSVRVAVPGTTYSTARLASVACRRRPADRSAALLLFFLGALGLAAAALSLPLRERVFVLVGLAPGPTLTTLLGWFGCWALAAGVAFPIGGGLIWRQARESHHLLLGVDSVQIEALCSEDEAFVTRVASAVVEAIVLRG